MKKFFIQSILLLILIFGALYFFYSQVPNNSTNQVSQQEDLRQVKINNVRVNVEIADTADKRKKGLGGRQVLASDSGMLFIFEKEGIQSFWMKGLSFPLDFIWIRSDKVVDITKNAKPPAPLVRDQDLPIYVPKEPVTEVLEVNGGFVNANGIKVGDKIEGLP